MPNLFHRPRTPSTGAVDVNTRQTRRESINREHFQDKIRSMLLDHNGRALFRKSRANLRETPSPNSHSTTSMEAPDIESETYAAFVEAPATLKVPISANEDVVSRTSLHPVWPDSESTSPASLSPMLETGETPESLSRPQTTTTSMRDPTDSPSSMEQVSPRTSPATLSRPTLQIVTAVTATNDSTEDLATNLGPTESLITPTNASPTRSKLVLHSPPMPQPIAHLPTLGLEHSEPSAAWGQCARGSLELAIRRGSCDSVSSPVALSQHRPPATRELTDAEVRKATRTMPVMNMTSHTGNSNDGGEAEDDSEEDDDDDDDDDDSAEGASAEATSMSSITPPPSVEIKGKCPVNREANQRPSGDIHTILESPLSTAGAGPSTGYFGTHTSNDTSNEAAESSSDTPDSAFFDSPEAGPSGTHHPPSTISVTGTSEGDGSIDDSTPVSPSVLIDCPGPPVSARPQLYSRASRSMINLSTAKTTTTTGLGKTSDIVASIVVSPPSVAAQRESWLRPPPTPSATAALLPTMGDPTSPHLKRRLSGSDLAPPPMYQTLEHYAHPGDSTPRPREEEGRESLPPYWCGVHIEGTLSRKLEFSSPGVQARDRSWKKYYFVLHGTALFMYKFDPTKVPLRLGEPYITVNPTEADAFLHVHLAPDRMRERSMSMSTPASNNTAPSFPNRAPGSRRNTVGADSTINRTPIGEIIHHHRRGTVSTPTRGSSPVPPVPNGTATRGPNARGGSAPPPVTRPRSNTTSSSADIKDPNLFKTSHNRTRSVADSVASSTTSVPIASHLPFAHNALVHIFSLQGAESGLAADYKKRQHCVRVRSEGQQFMLQTETARQCVQWIEAFQAATNVAMDLDSRPMPVQQTLPRRRRRRRPAPAATDANFADTPEGNAAAVAAAERADHERERMLAEDQRAAETAQVG